MSALSGFRETFVYQWVLASCSHQVITTAEEELFLAGVDKQVSVKDYFPLWTSLLVKEEKEGASDLFDAAMTAALNVLGKLDLSVKDSAEGETPDGDSSSSSPSRVKDFTLLANAASLLQHVCSGRRRAFAKWVRPFGLELVRLCVQFPDVSGLHRLVALTLGLLDAEACDEDTRDGKQVALL